MFGVGPEVARSPLDLYRRVWREHGDVVLLKALPWFKWYLVIHPDGVERVLQTNQANYRKPKMITKSIGLITGNGLVVNEGESWRKQRRLAQPAFHRQRLALLGERMTQAAEQMTEQWSETYARTHRHPAFWEQPEEFIPERFTPENSANRPRFAYFPFGGGARQCIGNHFAMMEAQFVIAVLASRFNLTLPTDSQPELDPTFALRSKNGLKMQLSN